MDLEIEELALHGELAGSHERLRRAFEREVGRLTRTRTGARSPRSVDQLVFRPTSRDPERLGEALARAVHARLHGEIQR